MNALRWLATAALAVAGLTVAGAVSAERVPQKHALVIGINKYVHTKAHLSFAVADMKAMKQVLEAQGFRVTPLQDEDATRERILLELIRLARDVEPEDTLLIYYAGHGVLGPTGTTYWLNHDGMPERPDLGGLRVMHMLDYVADIRARYKIIMLDHCFSAGMDEATLARLRDVVKAPAVAVALAALTAPMPPPTQSGHTARQIALGEHVPVIRQRVGGALFIAASRGVAHETVKDGHGVFTAAFLQALRDPTVEDGSPGLISVLELEAFVPRRTRELGEPDFIQDVYFDLNMHVHDGNLYYPFLRELKDKREVSAEVDRLLSQLDAWKAKGWFGSSAFDRTRQVLERWRDYGELADDKEIELVRAVREITRQYRVGEQWARARRLEMIIASLVTQS